MDHYQLFAYLDLGPEGSDFAIRVCECIHDIAFKRPSVPEHYSPVIIECATAITSLLKCDPVDGVGFELLRPIDGGLEIVVAQGDTPEYEDVATFIHHCLKYLASDTAVGYEVAFFNDGSDVRARSVGGLGYFITKDTIEMTSTQSWLAMKRTEWEEEQKVGAGD